MIPDPTDVTAEIVKVLGAEVMPHIGDAYARSVLGRAMMLLMMSGGERGRAAAWRAEENAELGALFAQALAAPIEWSPELSAALGGRPASVAASELSLPALDVSNRKLRSTLVDLHAAVEADPSPAARALEAAIWRALVASTERRKVPLARF